MQKTTRRRTRRSLRTVVAASTALAGLMATINPAAATTLQGSPNKMVDDPATQRCIYVNSEAIIPSVTGAAFDYNQYGWKTVRDPTWGCSSNGTYTAFSSNQISVEAIARRTSDNSICASTGAWTIPSGWSWGAIGAPYNPSGSCSSDHYFQSACMDTVNYGATFNCFPNNNNTQTFYV